MPIANVPSGKKPVFLLDSMSFIFRAYHAMQHQRPMSTRTGVPTAATFVFVNMINKLRRDFAPEFFAAIFDTSAPVFRDERAKAITTLRRWNSKLKDFEDIAYDGYKANRTVMPPDLAQQLPYIRRSLEAFHIPILQSEGFEADDVIGTLSRKAAEEGHPVFIVSNDKDMLQLVTEHVKVMNPMKDNLILDRDKVIETLGVPPEQVIDVMALRGDSIDNIPGAPGIGDKGSVDLIQQYGSLEGVLEHAKEVKRKTYRESLENNRETILLSKELVTIDCAVPLPLDLERMRTLPPDVAACRTLFNELEFTTMLKELAPEVETTRVEHILDSDESAWNRFATAAREHGFALALDASLLESIMEQIAASETEAIEEEAPVLQTMSMLDMFEEVEDEKPQASTALHIAVTAIANESLLIRLDASYAAEFQTMLADSTIPKAVHDLKGTLRVLTSHGIALAGVRDDIMLCSYLANPTHSTHRLADVVARFTSRPLQETTEKQLTEAAHSIWALAPILRAEIHTLGTEQVYSTIDLPLTPVLLRMEQAGVRIDRKVLDAMAHHLKSEMLRVGEEIYSLAGHRFNINSPKQLGDVLFNKMNLPRPMKYGKGKVVSTAMDVLEDLAQHNPVPRMVLEYRQLAKLKSNYVDSLPLLADAGRPCPYHLQPGWHFDRASIVYQSEPAEHSGQD